MFIKHMMGVEMRPRWGRIVSFGNVFIKIKSLRDYDVFSRINSRMTFIQKKYHDVNSTSNEKSEGFKCL